MRRRSIDLLHHADDFFELAHQRRLVLQPAGGVDHQHVDSLGARGLQRLVGEPRGIRAGLAGDDAGARALAPDFELIDRGGPEGVARGEHHALALAKKFSRELADRGGLAGTVDADHQDDEGF